MNVKTKGCEHYVKRSKSMCSLQAIDGTESNLHGSFKTSFSGYRSKGSRSVSESGESVELHVVTCGSDTSPDDERHDSGICGAGGDADVLLQLERRVDLLSDVFVDQCRLLSEIQEEVRSSRIAVEKCDPAQSNIISELLLRALVQGPSSRVQQLEDAARGAAGGCNSRARSLLDAIESKQARCLDREIRDALLDMLHSDELKERIVSATAEAVRGVIRSTFSQDMAGLYVPLLERSHRRLARRATSVLQDAFVQWNVAGLYLPLLQRSHRRLARRANSMLQDAFVQLEEKAASICQPSYRTSRALRRALDRHESLLDAAAAGSSRFSYLQYTVEEVLQKELKQWRSTALEALAPAAPVPETLPARAESPPLDSPVSPPQPADPETSIIDQLMKSAEINKLIRDGDVNGSFEKALSASDLSLVMAACRAADPAHVFAPPCRLSQHVLLSLVQQLATDLVHDTPLKCRYLEEAILSLHASCPATRAHLPLVVREVRKHLAEFLIKYPSHVANRRVTLIVMAADNLLK